MLEFADHKPIAPVMPEPYADRQFCVPAALEGIWVKRLRAPNPSLMTLDGTNGYVVPVGPGALVAIDPGVADRAPHRMHLQKSRAMRKQVMSRSL